MNSSTPDQAELVHRLRQQLILAQVRIMELEDVRDSLAPKLAELEANLAAAQSLADQKIDEAAHLESVRIDLTAQCRHLQHVQHVTHEALTASRTQLETITARLAAADQRGTQLQRELISLADDSRRLQAALGANEHALAQTNALAAAHAERIHELDRELRALKASRSWRWTRWLRTLERSLSGKKE